MWNSASNGGLVKFKQVAVYTIKSYSREFLQRNQIFGGDFDKIKRSHHLENSPEFWFESDEIKTSCSKLIKFDTEIESITADSGKIQINNKKIHVKVHQNM